MKKWTMREAYEELGVSRTTLQGWVDDILDKPTGVNENGWYFNEDDLEKLWKIRIYKQLKYKNIEIRNALFNKKRIDENSLQAQIEKLTEQKEELERLINIATIMKETGFTPSTIRFGIVGMENAPYAVVSLLMSGFSDTSSIEDGEISGYENLFEGESENLLEDVFNILDKLRKIGMAPHAPEAVKQVARLYEHFAETCCPSIIQFTSYFTGFYQDFEAANYIEQSFGEGYVAFLKSTVKHFVDTYEGKNLDTVFQNALDTIHTLGRKKHTASSAEVQGQICRIHDYIRDVGMISKRLQINRLRQFATVFDSDVVRELMDGDTKRGFAWFLSRAFDIYCNNLEKADTIE